ncbi:HEAT repeat domain-containing protein [Myroides sp. mNGS23_01]|nr:HEAT repeat domain-containing protein [Myroides sp. mNGS23_01]WHT38271.1 HEAT repeat domain-containing protein [Myroides sp. mNGS23_01]
MIVDMNVIKTELEKVGISINDIYDLVNTNESYPTAVPVLLNLLETGIDDMGTKEGVVRALAVKEAIGKASPILIAEYNRVPKDKMLLRWAIGNTIYTTITKDDVESILPIVQNKTNGISRQMFVAALGKVKIENVENVLINLLDDDDVIAHALEALGRMKSKKQKIKSRH